MTIGVTFRHVQIPVRGMLRAAAFYERVFGWQFTEAGDAAHGPGALGPSRGSERIAYLRSDRTGRPVVPELALAYGEAVSEAVGVQFAVGVDDIPRAADRVVAAGGRVVADAEPIDDIRTAVVADSEGNMLGLWQPGPTAAFWWRGHAGAQIVDGATIQYVELPAEDLNRAASFYESVFGWRFDVPHASHNPTGPVPSAARPLYGADVIRYCTTARPEVGLVRRAREPSAQGLQPAVGVADLDAALDALCGAGGAQLAPTRRTGDFHVVRVRDTEGNRFELMCPGEPGPARWPAGGAGAQAHPEGGGSWQP